jgi:hypothetical protein
MPGSRLAAARGAVRDGAAGIESFAHLLGSRRVGPRGVALALPEVCEGCGALVDALEHLVEAMGAGFAAAEDKEAAEAACGALVHASAEVARLEGELSPSHSGPPSRRGAGERGIDAKRRLALETSVRCAMRELDGALDLADLLIATLDLRPTPLDLIDVLRESSPSPAGGQRTVGITVVSEGGRANEIEGDVRVVSGLVEIAIALVSAAGAPNPELRAERRADGRFELRIGQPDPRVARRAIALELALRDGGEPAFAVARVVARRARIALDVADRVVTVTI